MRHKIIFWIIGTVTCLMIGVFIANAEDKTRLGGQTIYMDKYITDYLMNPNWGKAFELSNSINQAWALKQDIQIMQNRLNATNLYIREANLIFHDMKLQAIQAELNVRRGLVVFNSAMDLLDILSKAGNLKTDFAPSGPKWSILISPRGMIRNGVDRYADWEINRMHRPIDQRTSGLQYLQTYFVPSLRKEIEVKQIDYNIARNTLISKTLDAVEIIQAGHDYGGNLRSILTKSGTQLSDDLLYHRTKNFSPSPIAIDFTNPFTNRKETMVFSQQTYNALNKWGQQQLNVQMQFGQWLNNPTSFQSQKYPSWNQLQNQMNLWQSQQQSIKIPTYFQQPLATNPHKY